MLDEATRQSLRQMLQSAAAEADAQAFRGAMQQLLANDSRPADVQFSARLLTKFVSGSTSSADLRPLRTFIIRSVTVEPLLPYLQTEAFLFGYRLDLTVGGFGSYVDDVLNPQGALAEIRPDLLLIVLHLDDVAGRLEDLCADGIGEAVEEEISTAVKHLAHLLKSVRANSKARIFLQGFVLPYSSSLGQVGDANLPESLPKAVVRLNSRLASVCASVSDTVFFDVDAVAAQQGRRQWCDLRLFMASRLHVAPANFLPYARALVRSINTLYRAPRKVLCTDLDNTLWGGVLGEDGVQGIITGTTFPGTPYYSYQRYLKQLTARGILLVAVSKNNEADVREAFQARAADMALRLDDFIAVKANWNDKTQSLRELAEELSLGLDSFVFVDDNPVELEAVRQHLPEVALIAVPVDQPWKLLDLLADQPFFDVARVTSDDRNRLIEYKAQAERATLESSFGQRDEFLASLGMVCTFQSASEAPLARAVQLLSKTNQFNLTTRRHSASEIEAFAEDPTGQSIVVRVRDRFGDAGVVGLALARNHGSTCVIDSLLLSCRVIGRGVETALLARIAERAAQLGAICLQGEFIPSKKNAPCATFYIDHGFTPAAGNTDSSATSLFYELDLTTSTPALPVWIKLEGTPTNELATSTGFSSQSPG